MIDGRLGILYEDLWDECAEGGPEDPSHMQAALLVRFVCIVVTPIAGYSQCAPHLRLEFGSKLQMGQTVTAKANCK